ncbi:RluA family pseudouridine synthase [Bacillus mesophilum]|uniref:Pseudouridine synthase n=1 Tax=Bacillus mesophilum TaxID=1071718 RepID=A0A7V7RJJ7_9BACI|nr:RluA family pseudouridine synthase [Bacillus mesophilum]KAB2331042.1 RluA family pseudouridine synthase [Bacillus mesophilum]
MVTAKVKGEWYEITIPEQWNQVSVDHLFRNIWQASKKQIHFMRMEKHVLMNGEIAQWEKPIQTGDLLMMKVFGEEASEVLPEYMPIEVLFEDEHFIIFNKPAGMDTHPNEPGQKNTLANAAAFHVLSQGVQRNVRHIHRLDQDTSGCILFAKHPLAGVIADKLLEERKIKRTYSALVHGHLRKKSGTIHEPIGRDRHHPTRRRVSPKGQDAITHFSAFQFFEKEKLTFIQCQLDTGRTHQIRVHLSHIKHPLAGDTLYGGKPIFSRQALHAARLTFTHPFTLEKVDVTCPPPKEFSAYMKDH